MIRLVSPNGKCIAHINPVGAALSDLWLDGNQIAGAPDIYSGVTLFPWPNRIYGGVWRFRGAELALPINDAEQNSSLHGLVYDQKFELVQRDINICDLRHVLIPSDGYPFSMQISVRYLLTNDGLEITHLVYNDSNQNAPFSIGFHPYFKVDRESQFESSERSFSVGAVQVDETLGRMNGPVSIHTADYHLEIAASDTEYFHVFINRYSTPSAMWLAVEPQSSPADSLNTGIGVTWLQGGESRQFRYSLAWRSTW